MLAVYSEVCVCLSACLSLCVCLSVCLSVLVQISQSALFQCRIKVGAIDAAALGPFKKQAHGHGRENEKSLLCFGCNFLVGTISRKSFKLLPPDVIFYS